MANRTHGLPAPFFDLAMGVVFVFMALFMLSTFDTPKPSAGTLTPKAEFIVELTWNDGSADDIDLMAKGPDGNIVYFSKRETALMALDRDNVGTNNVVDMADGTKQQIADRRETVTIRSLVPGEYSFNALAYRKNDPGPTKVGLKITKLNPYHVVTVAEVTMDTERQETTMATMRVAADGSAEAYLVPVRMVQ